MTSPAADLTPRTLVYQIFVDRFAGDGGAPLADPPAGAEAWTHHAGGTLDGIAARLEHVTALGADCLYLTPIFPAPSNHKYDPSAYDRVDERFGGDAAWERLAEACRARGLGLVLDGVFNHTGEAHPWFRAARASATAPEAALFRFSKHPDAYDRWRGFGHLPELAHERAEVRARFTAPDGVVARWIRRGATGWRLDCANDLGPGFCAEIAAAARAAGATDGVVGEVMAWAADFCADGRPGAVMNYWLREVLLSAARGELDGRAAGAHLGAMLAAWPAAGLRRSWNLLGTHDTPRLATVLPDAAPRAFARALCFALPGVPHVYYGDELGMTGGADPANRAPMRWDVRVWDHAVMTDLRSLVALRRALPALTRGAAAIWPQPQAPAALVIARTTGDPRETVVVVANCGHRRLSARLFLPGAGLWDAMPLCDARGVAPTARLASGALPVELAPFQVAFFTPDDTTIPGYRFLRVDSAG